MGRNSLKAALVSDTSYTPGLWREHLNFGGLGEGVRGEVQFVP